MTAPSPPTPESVREEFEVEHERRYGYRDPEMPIEVVTVAVSVVSSAPPLTLAGSSGGELERSSRQAHFGDASLDTEILRGEPGEGVEPSGPCVFELPETTLVLPPGWSARVDADGTVICSHYEGTA